MIFYECIQRFFLNVFILMKAHAYLNTKFNRKVKQKYYTIYFEIYRYYIYCFSINTFTIIIFGCVYLQISYACGMQ